MGRLTTHDRLRLSLERWTAPSVLIIVLILWSLLCPSSWYHPNTRLICQQRVTWGLIRTHPNSSKLIRAIIFIAIASSSGTLFLKSRPTCGIRGLWARGPYFSLGKLRKYLSNFVKAGERETTNPPTTSLFLIFARKSGLARGWACVFSSVLSFFSRVFARSVLLAVIVGGLVLSRRWAYFASHPQQCLPSSKSSGNFAFYARFFLPCQSARVECLGLHNRLA